MVDGTPGSLNKAGSMTMALSITLTAGIDTGKEKLDIAVHGQKGALTVTNNARGWKELTAHLAEAGVGRVGCGG
jgi:transposase